MKKGAESHALNEAINLLRIKRAQELALLRDQFHLTYESLKPINLIKHTFTEAASTTEIKEGILNNVVGLTTGYLSKAIFIGSSISPVRKIVGTLLQLTIAALVSRNSDSIKSMGRNVLNKIFKTPVETGLKNGVPQRISE